MDRQCSSGLQAVADVAADIRVGFYEIGKEHIPPKGKLLGPSGTFIIGNYIQVSDSVGAVLLMKRSIAVQKGLPIFGVFRTFATVGVDLAIMGVGPAATIAVAIKATNLELNDIDFFEINAV
nr:3-ketoacyl-coa thiolase 2, peroxisomal [Quercus suber]